MDASCTSSLPSFFFCGCGGPRDFHSFPTRRSSDLVRCTSEPSSCGSRSAPRASAAAGGWSPTDRKSTRLNSSHVATSYAVFCLKKKRTQSPVGYKEDVQAVIVRPHNERRN